ncbi:MAG TPA: aminotransferase class I/II-fold pyridoxal phosphate-dependent enzyme [Candidatus Limnocylindrales bacterium]|nr:aminotransferase class I/II-fold pyridoxal phosphate-dependent enzyme [Candidatus Limnocylindrales bacterium]
MSLPRVAARLGQLPPYPLALLNQRVRELTTQGIDVVNVDVGSPDLPPPPSVVETLSASAWRSNTHGYSGYRGLTDFRRAVADYYLRRFGLVVDPERHVLPLLGSKEGIVNLSLAYLDRGDKVVVPDIGYPSYSMGAYLASAGVTFVPMRPENGYLLNFDEISGEVLDGAKLMWVNYPNNPTGAVASLAYYQQVVDFCRAHNLLLASDNPYVEITYDGLPAPSVLQAEGALDGAVEFISFSKTYNMAGWRLGAAVGAEKVIEALLQVKSNVDSGHFIPIYEAGIEALDHVQQAWIDDRNAVYRRRRDRMLDVLPAVGLDPFPAQGALYVWARVLDDRMTGADYASAALAAAHVSMAPGIIYGPRGDHFVRLSVCVPDARLEEALARLQAWHTGP